VDVGDGEGVGDAVELGEGLAVAGELDASTAVVGVAREAAG
jgi:hypothetical protein